MSEVRCQCPLSDFLLFAPLSAPFRHLSYVESTVCHLLRAQVLHDLLYQRLDGVTVVERISTIQGLASSRLVTSRSHEGFSKTSITLLFECGKFSLAFAKIHLAQSSADKRE
jgi:hypothetical protein